MKLPQLAQKRSDNVKTIEKITRRSVLVRGVQVPAAGFVALTFGACGEKESGILAEVCADPDLLSKGELSLRESLQYVEVYEDPDQACGKCTYFNADENSSCGHCQIFNGPANPNGHCTSWSLRES